jgi:rubrerythrin
MNQETGRSLKVLSAALEMEDKGRSFYEKAKETCRNPLGREMFGILAGEELVHADRIRKIYEALTTHRGWTEEWVEVKGIRQDLGKFFRDLAVKHGREVEVQSDDLEAVKMGMDFELASIRFYEEQLSLAADPLEKAFLDQMAAEEKGHYQALADTHYYLSDPRGWFMEKERAGLDGM